MTLSQKLHEVRKVVSRRRKIQFLVTFLIILINAIFETIALVALVPFLSVLSSPQTFMTSKVARSIGPILGFTSSSEAVSLLCVSFGVITLLSAALRILTLIINSKFTLALGADLSCIIFDRTLNQPYSSHVNQNSASVIANITSNTGAFVNGMLTPCVQLLTSGLTVVGTVATLIAINWWVALTTMFVFGFAYLGFVHLNRSVYAKNSAVLVTAQDQIIMTLQEGLGAIRDVIVDGNHRFYTQSFADADNEARLAYHSNYVFSATPKHVLEALGMLMICAVSVLLSVGEPKFSTTIPVLGTLAMGAQRLLPAMQSVYASYSSIAGNRFSLDRIVSVLSAEQNTKCPHDVCACGVSKSIQLVDVEFHYSKDAPLVLRKLSFEVKSGERIGIIGATGSGKSTTMDLLLALLEPTSGQILIDGEPLVGDKVFAWQKSLSHVPQVIYLADASIAENIAFGLPKDKIDMEQVRKAARLAQIAEHIETLDAGYDTFVGERGIRLSGGQRQRIGIARALYKNATVLVFDEATSALDDETEAELMKAIDGLSKDLTVIMIAHRLSTVRRCDKILKLHKGKVVAFDTPDVVLGPVSAA